MKSTSLEQVVGYKEPVHLIAVIEKRDQQLTKLRAVAEQLYKQFKCFKTSCDKRDIAALETYENLMKELDSP